jgi:hypothetical protein
MAGTGSARQILCQSACAISLLALPVSRVARAPPRCGGRRSSRRTGSPGPSRTGLTRCSRKRHCGRLLFPATGHHASTFLRPLLHGRYPFQRSYGRSDSTRRLFDRSGPAAVVNCILLRAGLWLAGSSAGGSALRSRACRQTRRYSHSRNDFPAGFPAHVGPADWLASSASCGDSRHSRAVSVCGDG